MNRTVSFVTPENITVTYQVAGIASRFMALLVDMLIQIIIILGIFQVMRLAGVAGQVFGSASLVSAFGIVAIYMAIFAYALFFEAAWGGRTPGKRLFGLRVVREGGYPLTFVASAVRNILRFMDFGILPLGGTVFILCGLPGLISIFASPAYKRIGDYAAGTLVIVEAGTTPLGRQSAVLPPNAVALLPYIRNLDRMTPEEYRLVRRFVSRRNEFEIVVQAALGERLARPLMQKLDLEPPIVFQLQYADLLEALEHCYANERGML